MPRFNFAEDPDKPKQKPAKSPPDPKYPARQQESKEPGQNVEQTASEPARESSERRIPYDEAVPEVYRSGDSAKYTGPPSTDERKPETTPDAITEPEELLQHQEEPEIPQEREQVHPGTPAPEEPLESSRKEDPLPQDEADEDFENPFDNLDHKEYLTEPTSPTDEYPDDPGQASRKSFLPLVGIAAVVLFLISISVIWFLNPYPPLRAILEGFFYGPRTEQPAPGEAGTENTDGSMLADTLDETPVQERDWNYYLQISAFKELYKAQDDANRLRKLGLNAKVEGEFIPSQRKTYYRVRLGPFQSAEAAALKGDSLKDVIPSSAFVDSIRVEADVVDSLSNEAPIQQPVLKKPARRTTQAKPAQPIETQSETTTVPSAKAGYAVAVGAYKSLQTAQHESRTLIGRGLPAYTSKSVQNGTIWYRVLVGPFRTREEAERYLKIVEKESGGAAYIRDLGK